MLYYLAAAGLQATPYIGAAAGLAADLRDVFSDHDATLSYLKEAGLVDPRYQIEKHAWEHAAAAAGVLLTVVGAQATTRLPKLTRALERLGPNGGARLRVAMRQLSTRVMGRRARNAERLALSDTLSRPAEAAGNPLQSSVREMLPGLHQVNPQETGILRSAEHRLAQGELPRDAGVDASRAVETSGGSRAIPRPSVFGPADPDTQIPQTGPTHVGPDVFSGPGIGSAPPSRVAATAIAQGQALVPSELQAAMASIRRVISRMAQARPPSRGLEQAYAKALRRAAHHMAAFREDMLGRSILSPDEARELAAAVFKDFTVRNDETVNRHLAEAIRWTDGKGLTTIERIEANSNRAFASFENRTIDVSYSQFELKETLLHEFGHHWEYTDPVARAAAYEWRAARATSGLPELFLGEEVLPDHFISPYVGRFYPDNDATEVLSMGLQYLSNPEYMVELMLGDMEHFHLMMGLLRGGGRR